MKSVIHSLIIAILFLAATNQAHAGLLTSDSGFGTTTTFTTTGGADASQLTLNGFVVTGNPLFRHGNDEFGLGANGPWSPGGGNFSWVAANSESGSVKFDLGGLYQSVGGFMNYAPGSGADPTISVLAADGTTVVASFNLATLAPISTPDGVNAGAFRGISSTTPFEFFQIQGSFILVHNLEVGGIGTTAIPEPTSIAVFGMLAAGAALYSWRRRRLPNV